VTSGKQRKSKIKAGRFMMVQPVGNEICLKITTPDCAEYNSFPAIVYFAMLESLTIYECQLQLQQNSPL
jgi:hypothetical protein